ncbi:hypothetical protein ACFQ5M_01620 [Agrilactobacillus yilanensis]|uniref:DUF1700 domain-containing protein n=1 Tax=Agrilactobacillus yilanensis TaxID=2485997 RepID=A0ABW4J568_9LACO|nr:hypothetical protein [Agrilactobacillus yilanensis]
MTLTTENKNELRTFAVKQAAKADGDTEAQVAAITQKIDEIDELTGYMEDHMQALLTRGYTENKAIAQTKQDFAIESDLVQKVTTKHQQDEAYKAYYAKNYTTEKGIATQEAVGLYYGAAILIMAVIGFILGCAVNYWLKTTLFGMFSIIGVPLGVLIGVGIGLLQQAKIVRKNLPQ